MSLSQWGYFFYFNLILNTFFFLTNNYSYSQPLLASVNTSFSSKLDELIQAHNSDPYDVNTIILLANEYYNLNNLHKATELIFKALQLQPNNIQAYFLLGSVYKAAKQYEDSLYCFQKVIKINPNSYISYFNIGNIYEDLGNIEAAKEAYGKALSINPNFTIALTKLKELNNPNFYLSYHTLNLPYSKISSLDNLESKSNKSSNHSKFTEQKPPTISYKHIDLSKDSIINISPPKLSNNSSKENKKNNTSFIISQDLNTKTSSDKVTKIAKKTENIHSLQQKTNQLYDLAMQEYKNDNLPKAIELFVRALLTDKSLIAEPDNGLLKDALEFLKNRPNALSHGLFYRGFLNYLNGNIIEAAKDIELYILQNSSSLTYDPVFYEEAQKIISKYHQEIEYINFVKNQKASETVRNLVNSLSNSFAKIASEPNISFNFNQFDKNIIYNISTSVQNINIEHFNNYTIEYIIENAKELVKQHKYNEALALLAFGLDKEPENVQILFALGNTYVEIYIATNNLEAAKLARDFFYKVTQLVDQNSSEFKLAYSYIEELDSKLNQQQ